MSEVEARPALLFDLDGTLVDSVYQHVLAWQEVLANAGIDLSVWRIHGRIGMSGGLFVNTPMRETGCGLAPEEARQLQEADGRAYQARLARPAAASPSPACRCRTSIATLSRPPR